MIGLGKSQLHAKFEVASPSRCRNIKGRTPNFGSSPRPRLHSLFLLMGFNNGPWLTPAACQNLKSLALSITDIYENLFLNDKFAFWATVRGSYGAFQSALGHFERKILGGRGRRPIIIVGTRKLECLSTSQRDCVILSSFVWVQYQRVTDRRMDRRTELPWLIQRSVL